MKILISILILFLGTMPSFADEMWKAKAPNTDHVADWSKADKRDREATDYFLKNIWPKLRKVSEKLHGQISDKTGLSYNGKMSEREKKAGVVVFPLKIEATLPWYAVPTEKQIASRKVILYAAQGQSEAFAIAVHSFTKEVKVTVVPGDLKGPGTISSKSISSRFSLSYSMIPRSRKKVATRQMILLNVDSWKIPKNRTYEWVIDVHVPADAKTGLYKGPVKVMADGIEVASIELTFEVLPIKLSDNGCRWGSFMTPQPGNITEAWCDINSRYCANSLAWWNLDNPNLTWKWDGIKRKPLVLAKLRYANGKILSKKDKAKLPTWIQKRTDGPYVVFTEEEVTGLPIGAEARRAYCKKQLKMKASLGNITPELAAWVCYDRPGNSSNFNKDSIKSIAFEENDDFKRFDKGMKLLKKHGFAGPITWFGAGGPTVPWETRVLSQRFGVKYSRAKWKWERAVTPKNSNHVWYLANAAIAKSLHEARKKHDWPEIVWCPCDESFQYKGVTGRAVPNMIAEMMPYVRMYAPDTRIYQVVWHTKKDNWKGIWQCGVMQKLKKTKKGKTSQIYGPYNVICTNCPNDLDRKTTWESGGEYWVYTFITATVGKFYSNRFAFGLNGARHSAALIYNFADTSRIHNITTETDILKSHWITGQYNLNWYFAKDPKKIRQADLALASHAMLACRSGMVDRKYIETLRRLAYKKKSIDDIAFLEKLPTAIDKLGGAGKGGVDDFTAEITDENGVDKLRREIALRIKKLLSR
ncbi:MAG: hypothetical protein COA79_25760 [Planctomycetota bacterium]|nr:MAG: hypothetical protein COA79_25760 [Planctomycetota bacterium]